MQAAMIAPNKVQIGIQNQKLDIFDDGIQLQKAGGLTKIQAIRVFFKENYIRGFEIFYKLKAGDLLKAGHNVPKSKKELQNVLLEIGPDDYVSEIFGAYQSAKKNRIINITFITYRGKVQTFGGKGDKSFGFCYPGSTFGAFKGGYKKSVEWLEIDVIPLPEDFKIEMEKLGILKIQQISIQPERTSSNTGQGGSLIVIPKIQVAKPMITVSTNNTLLANQQNKNLQQQQPYQNVQQQQYPLYQQQQQQQYPYQQQQQYPQQQQQQYPYQQQQQYPYQQQQQQYPQQQQQQQQQYPQYPQQQQQQYPFQQQQQTPFQQNVYVPYNQQQPQNQNGQNNNSYPKYN